MAVSRVRGGGGRFAACVCCMDGRIQLPLISFIQDRYGVSFVDIITEPGPSSIWPDTRTIPCSRRSGSAFTSPSTSTAPRSSRSRDTMTAPGTRSRSGRSCDRWTGRRTRSGPGASRRRGSSSSGSTSAGGSASSGRGSRPAGDGQRRIAGPVSTNSHCSVISLPAPASHDQDPAVGKAWPYASTALEKQAALGGAPERGSYLSISGTGSDDPGSTRR